MKSPDSDIDEGNETALEDNDNDTEDIDDGQAAVLPDIYAWPSSFHRYCKTTLFLCVYVCVPACMPGCI